MIGFMPSIYTNPNELVYCWFARYYTHSGHPAYVFAIEDLLEKKNIRPDVEFINRLNSDAKDIITKMISMEDLILNHTMFPYYRFAENNRLCNALKLMIETDGDAHQLLPVSKNRAGGQTRYIKYCPICAAEARQFYGEAYWSRTANIRNMDVCAYHKCRLKKTNIVISGKQSGRLFVADAEIKDVEPEFVNEGLELQFAKYLTDVFQKPINMNNTVDIGVFLNSKLEGTQYLSTRGMMRNVSLLFDDIIKFYEKLPNQGITRLSQIQKIFTGYRWDFYEICQIAFFLNISVYDLINPKKPEKSQTELFNEKVARLYDAGLGCYRIAKEMDCSPSTARKANQVKPKAGHDYSVRKGMKKADWEQMDNDMIQQVRDVCEQIYYNAGGRPGRVTEYAVCRVLEIPSKRFDYLPLCRAVIQEYTEDYEVYWAREVVWCYQHLIDTIGKDSIKWRDIRDITNLRKANFIASFPYLNQFTDGVTAEKIKALLPVQETE